ncbi:MAG: hypothetical protein JO000_02475 [Alphaproteobacteria bacterium]|nr:hypothetical protein [Alphaproteobacteria bacterium]
MAASAHPHDYERSDADPRLIAAIALGIVVFLAASPFILSEGYPWATWRGSTRGLPQPPAPRLEIKPRESLDALRARENAALSQYGWADRQRGITRIPIDRAAALLAQRGWPARAAGGK